LDALVFENPGLRVGVERCRYSLNSSVHGVLLLLPPGGLQHDCNRPRVCPDRTAISGETRPSWAAEREHVEVCMQEGCVRIAREAVAGCVVVLEGLGEETRVRRALELQAAGAAAVVYTCTSSTLLLASAPQHSSSASSHSRSASTPSSQPAEGLLLAPHPVCIPVVRIDGDEDCMASLCRRVGESVRLRACIACSHCLHAGPAIFDPRHSQALAPCPSSSLVLALPRHFLSVPLVVRQQVGSSLYLSLAHSLHRVCVPSRDRLEFVNEFELEPDVAVRRFFAVSS